MNARNRIGFRLPLAAILAVMLNGCVVAPSDDYYVGGRVVVAPPPVRVEVFGAAPGPGYIWISGYWDWNHGRHVWRPGHWAAPRHGHHWIPHRWMQEGRYWRLQRGHWARD